MKHFARPLLFATALALAGNLALARPALAARAVVELYTSQGCSSCPPADKILSELSANDDVIALSFHVTYWDYLGWRDTFGDPANTKRQRWYKSKLGAQVYTPQLVVNGTAQAVGSNRMMVSDLVKAASPLPVPVSLIDNAGTLSVQLGDAPAVQSARVLLVQFDSERSVAIKRGENRGHTMTYSNVVRSMTPIGSYAGQSTLIDLSSTPMGVDGANWCAIIVQDEKTGRILGAEKAPLR